MNIYIFLNKFVLGEYVHIHSVILIVCSVKYSQITKFTLKNQALEQQIYPCYE